MMPPDRRSASSLGDIPATAFWQNNGVKADRVTPSEPGDTRGLRDSKLIYPWICKRQSCSATSDSVATVPKCLTIRLAPMMSHVRSTSCSRPRASMDVAIPRRFAHKRRSGLTGQSDAALRKCELGLCLAETSARRLNEPFYRGAFRSRSRLFCPPGSDWLALSAGRGSHSVSRDSAMRRLPVHGQKAEVLGLGL